LLGQALLLLVELGQMALACVEGLLVVEEVATMLR
jgi:hypothetical protein